MASISVPLLYRVSCVELELNRGSGSVIWLAILETGEGPAKLKARILSSYSVPGLSPSIMCECELLPIMVILLEGPERDNQSSCYFFGIYFLKMHAWWDSTDGRAGDSEIGGPGFTSNFWQIFLRHATACQRQKWYYLIPTQRTYDQIFTQNTNCVAISLSL